MRALLAVLAVLGLAGVIFGILTIVQGVQQQPFSYENYGGPGSIIAGLVLMSVSLYLILNWPRWESSSRKVHHE